MVRQKAEQNLADDCWQCGAHLRAEWTICLNCGAARVPASRVENLATPANGWLSPTEMFAPPKRYAAQYQVTLGDLYPQQDDDSPADEPAEPAEPSHRQNRLFAFFRQVFRDGGEEQMQD